VSKIEIERDVEGGGVTGFIGISTLTCEASFHAEEE
jgi:hypothetical protein